MSCNTCKQKPQNNITSLTMVNMEELKTAYEYTLRMSEMNTEKWDTVIDVYLQLFPTKNTINRGCKDCMINITKAVQHEYNRLSVKNEEENSNGRKTRTRKTKG
jgi:hypothetical protein